MLQDAGCDLMFMPEVGEIYPNGAANATRVEVPGISQHPVRRVPPGPFRGRRHRRRQAVPHRRSGRRDLRREGLPAAHGDPPHGRGPVPARGDRRRADGARERRARHELAQPVPVARASASSRRLSTASCSRRWRRCSPGVRDFARIEGTGRAALDAAGFRTDYFSVRDARTLAAGAARHAAVRGAHRRAARQGAPHRQPAVVRPGNGRLIDTDSRWRGPSSGLLHVRHACSAGPIPRARAPAPMDRRAAPRAPRGSRGSRAHCPAPRRYCATSVRNRCGGWPSLRCAPGIPLRVQANSSREPRRIEADAAP